ncbi:MAG: transposase [Pleurocapsa sp. MO_192.B19]|nr:transposase [Pleurocapsa sp. MO_192.B19]
MIEQLLFIYVYKNLKIVFTKEILQDLETIFQDVCQDFETELVEMNGETEHVHLPDADLTVQRGLLKTL